MIKAFFYSKDWALWAWGGLLLIIALISAQVYMSVMINEWYGVFWDSLQNLDYAAFKDAIWDFCWLAGGYILLATASFFVTQHYTFRWRKALTMAYIPLWEQAGTDLYEGSSQRIQEDCMKFAAYTQRLGFGLFRAILTLIMFIPLLWGLSEGMVFYGYEIPGLLVWMALTVSLGGMLISWIVGHKLPRLEYNNQKVEAAFRKQLVLAEDDKNYADVPTLLSLFTGVEKNYFKLYSNYKYFTFWENTYFQFSLLIPYLIAAPSFFAQIITLGVLSQIRNAFDKVHQSFSFFLDNWILVNELRSIIMRLREFEEAIGYK